MNDELVPVEVFPISFNRNRVNRIRSVIRTSKHGLLNFSFSQMDASFFPQIDSKILEGFADGGAENLDKYYDDYEE
jgi:hypothetical protein